MGTNTYTLSVYAKKSERDWLYLEFFNIGISSYFDLNNGIVGTISGGTATIKPLVNGWYKCSITGTDIDNPLQYSISVAISNDNHSYQGDGTSGIYIFGANLTETYSSYPFIYNGTEGEETTCLGDNINGSGDVTGFTNLNTSGVLYAEIAANDDELSSSTISLSDQNLLLNYVSINYSNTGNYIQGRVYVGGGIQCLITYPVSDMTIKRKIALRWKYNDFKMYINGYSVGYDLLGNTFSSNTLSSLQLNRATIDDNFYGNITEIGVYNVLTDEEMIELTT